MFENVLPKRGKRSSDDSISPSNEGCPGTVESSKATVRDSNSCYADAEELAKLLMEQSRKSKSKFFNTGKARRAIKMRHPADNLKGIEAPSSTPDLHFLSKCPSTISTAATPTECKDFTDPDSKLSLAHSCSTAPDSEPGQAIGTSNKEALEISEEGSLTSKDEETGYSPMMAFPRTLLFSSFAKLWGHNFIQEIKAPLRRRIIRHGKEPTVDLKFKRSPPITRVRGQSETPNGLLEYAFSCPSTSRQLDCLNLVGGTGPPKYLSENTLNELDRLDRERASIMKELARIDKERIELLRKSELEVGDDGLVLPKANKQKRRAKKEKSKSKKATWKEGSQISTEVKMELKGLE